MNYNAIAKHADLVRGSALGCTQALDQLRGVVMFSDDEELTKRIARVGGAYDKYIKALDALVEYAEAAA